MFAAADVDILSKICYTLIYHISLLFLTLKICFMKNAFETVKELLEKQCDAAEAEKISPASRLRDDLHLNSLEVVDVSLEIGKITGVAVKPEEIEKWKTVGDIVDTFSRQ